MKIIKNGKNEFLKELTWAKLTVSFINTRRIPGAVPFYMLVNSVIKDVTKIVTGSYDNQHRIFAIYQIENLVSSRKLICRRGWKYFFAIMISKYLRYGRMLWYNILTSRKTAGISL